MTDLEIGFVCFVSALLGMSPEVETYTKEGDITARFLTWGDGEARVVYRSSDPMQEDKLFVGAGVGMTNTSAIVGWLKLRNESEQITITIG